MTFESDICAECGEPIDPAEERESLTLCNACEVNRRLDASSYDPESGDYAITDAGAMSSAERVCQYGRVLFDCWPESTNAMIRAHAERAQFWPGIKRISDHGNVIDISASVYADAGADPARIVYCGAIGWPDCDPLGSVAGFDLARVETQIAENLAEERERADNDWIPEMCADCDRAACDCGDACDCDDPDLDDLTDYGVCTFTLADAIRDMFGDLSSGDDREHFAELMRDGIVNL